MKTQIMYLMTESTEAKKNPTTGWWCRKATKFAIILAVAISPPPNFLGLDRKLFAL